MPHYLSLREKHCSNYY